MTDLEFDMQPQRSAVMLNATTELYTVVRVQGREECSLLSPLCARNLKLNLFAPAGVTFELMNGYKLLYDGSWQLPDLRSEGEVWALVKVTVAGALLLPANVEGVEILKGFLSFNASDTNKAGSRACSLRLPQVPVADWAALAEHEQVTARVREVRVAQSRQQVRVATTCGDWRTVNRLRSERDVVQHFS